MSSVTRKFSAAVTGVFWDLDGCPIPVGLSPASIYDNIKLALNNMGYTGALSVSAYSLKSLNKEDFESASINLVQPGSVSAKRESMFGDVCLWGLKHPYEPTNLMVISKNTWLLENDYLSAFPLLKDKENNILLTLSAQDPSNLLKEVATSVLLWTSLSTGGYPLGTPTSKFSTAKTGVIWDLEDCPIPCGLTPASVSQNIQLALKNMGYTGQVSVTAYSLTDQNKEDFESATIKLVQPGSASAKRESIFVDLYGWGLKHRHEPTNLLLISKNFSEDLFYVRALLNLKEKENNILLAQPENPGGALCGIPTSFWLWSSLSDGGSPLDSQSVSSSQIVAPSPSSSPPCSGTSVRVAKKKKMKRRHKKLETSSQKPKSTN